MNKKPDSVSNKLFSKSQIFFYLFAIVIFIFVLYYFSEIKSGIKLLEKVNIYWLIIAVISQACTYVLGAIIYRQLLRLFTRKPFGFWKLIQANIVALFLNQAVPSAGISGNTFFFNFFRKKDIPTQHVLSLISIELLSFYAAMEVVTIFAILTSLILHKLSILFVSILCGGLLLYALFALAIGLAGRKRSIALLFKKIKRIKICDKLVEKLKSRWSAVSLGEMENPEQLILEHKGKMFTVLLYQVIIFLTDSFTIYALFRGLGISVSYLYTFIALIAAKIISTLPISPGGLILYESSMTFFFVKLALPVGASITVTLLYRILSFWLPMPIGFFMYKKLHA